MSETMQPPDERTNCYLFAIALPRSLEKAGGKEREEGEGKEE